MKRSRKFIGLFLALCILMLNAMSVLAAENVGIMPYWTDVSTVTSSMKVGAWGVATVTASGTAASTSSANSTEIIVDLQQYKNNSWNTLKTWTNQNDDKVVSIGEGKYAIAKGYEYRLYITVKVYKDKKLLETVNDIYYYGLYS